MNVTLEAARADALLHGTGITPEQALATSLVLAAHADTPDELRLWLEILGLLPSEPGGQLTCSGRRSTAGQSALRRQQGECCDA